MSILAKPTEIRIFNETVTYRGISTSLCKRIILRLFNIVVQTYEVDGVDVACAVLTKDAR